MCILSLFKKKNKGIKLQNSDFVKLPMKKSEHKLFMDIPKICAINLSKKTIDCIENQGYNLYKGSFGNPVQTNNKEPRKGLFCLLNHNLPENIHEYDVFIIDMINKEVIPYKQDEHIKKHVDTNTDIYFFSQFPQTLFDPRAFSAYMIRNKLNTMVFEREIFIVVFASEHTESEYLIVEKNDYQAVLKETKKIENYSYFSSFPNCQNKTGTKIYFKTNNPELHRIVSKYDFKYNIIFEHPPELKNVGRFYNNPPDPFFTPLMYNKDNEIISYHQKIGKSNVFVFPELMDISDFVNDFLSDYAPIIAPNLFPFSANFLWKNSQEYYLPNHENLMSEKSQIEKEYQEKIQLKENQISENSEKYKFLHNVLTETGDNLVNAVIEYLKWLGFSNIKNMDEEKRELFEEDLQIETNEGLLLIEVKGIGGTSTDSQCSQIAKNIQRRMKELNRTDVFGIYLVNNERYKPPLNRTIPPFDKHKIDDAESGQRGLLTTWQLFSLYSMINIGLIEKEEARAKFTDYGLIVFNPKFKSVLGIDKIYRREKETIISIDVVNQKISTGNTVYVLNDGRYTKHKVLSIQVNKKQVDNIDNGKVGLMLEGIIKQKSTLS